MIANKVISKECLAFLRIKIFFSDLKINFLFSIWSYLVKKYQLMKETGTSVTEFRKLKQQSIFVLI